MGLCLSGEGGWVSVQVGGGSLFGGSLSEGSLSKGISGGRPHPPVNRITDTSKNITFPQTSFAGGNKRTHHH